MIGRTRARASYPVGHTRFHKRSANEDQHGTSDERWEKLSDDTGRDERETDRPDTSKDRCTEDGSELVWAWLSVSAAAQGCIHHAWTD